MPTLRLLPTRVTDGPTQMALDDAILRTAADTSAAALRFYRWSAPTLSLGYFQASADRLSDPLLAALPWVRRASGGGAIVHDRELTYALALPAGSAWQPRGESWTCRVHYLLVEALADFGVTATAVPCGGERQFGPFLCFEHHTPGDLVIGESKVVGSAQRRYHGATVQHGSVLLARSEHAPSLAGILEQSGVAVDFEGLADALVSRLKAATGWAVESGAWRDAEEAHAAAQVPERFGNAEWNGRR